MLLGNSWDTVRWSNMGSSEANFGISELTEECSPMCVTVSFSCFSWHSDDFYCHVPWVFASAFSHARLVPSHAHTQRSDFSKCARVISFIHSQLNRIPPRPKAAFAISITWTSPSITFPYKTHILYSKRFSSVCLIRMYTRIILRSDWITVVFACVRVLYICIWVCICDSVCMWRW